ncbi:MAG TPA: response regulator [Ktedonobacterales bacterium]|nr:response regulator [Ktedonobacterales bacterium]
MPDDMDSSLASAPMSPVCVVDDDPGIRDSLRFLLEDAGYVVELIADGSALIALLRADPRPRVVLLDRMMTRLDGIETLRQLQDDPARQQAVIIFMTARHDSLDPETRRLMERTTFTSVTKPFDLDTLLAAVELACERLAERLAQDPRGAVL